MTTNCDTRAARARILAAALPLVPFNGWGHATWEGAVKESGLDIREARRVFPRNSLDLALEYEATLDREMVRKLEESASELESLRFRDRVVYAVMKRFELADREVLRKSTASFALPHHAAPGAHALWKTADTIWNALNDTSKDVNWVHQANAPVGDTRLDEPVLDWRRVAGAVGNLGVSRPAHRRRDAN